jgi:CDP-diacylglycerol--serine O-phosphatidyltransferase
MSLELPNPKPRPVRKGPFRRGIYILPSLFTVGTLVCGYFAILSTLKGSQMLAAGIGAGLSLVAFDNAAKAIGWAVLFDGLDGRIARLTNSTSDFGREFDSLADVITFGIAPAFLAYAWGVRSLEEVYGTQLVQHLRQIGWIITFTFVICGAARLARFNIDSTKATGDRRYFIGLPIPAAAGVVAALVHWAKYPVNEWTFGIVWLGVIAVLGFLMVSRVRYPSFKTIDLRRRRPYVAIILIGLIVWAIWAFSEPVLLTIALTYCLSGPVARLTSRFRPHPPAPEEVHAS